MIEKYSISYQLFDDIEDLRKCPLIKKYVPGAKCDTTFNYKLYDESSREIMREGI